MTIKIGHLMDVATETIMTPEPEQVFYKISELSDLLGVETSVLRFWEKEFAQIKPLKVGPRKRLYRRKDFETFLEIKRLLYEERYTIAGAQKRLDRFDSRQGCLFDDDDKIGAPPPFPATCEEPPLEALRKARGLLNQTRKDLLTIRKILTDQTGPVATKATKAKLTKTKKVAAQPQDLLNDAPDQ